MRLHHTHCCAALVAGSLYLVQAQDDSPVVQELDVLGAGLRERRDGRLHSLAPDDLHPPVARAHLRNGDTP